MRVCDARVQRMTAEDNNEAVNRSKRGHNRELFLPTSSSTLDICL